MLALGFTYLSFLITVGVFLLKILLNFFFFFALYIYITRFDLQICVLNIVFNRQLFTSNFKACLKLNYLLLFLVITDSSPYLPIIITFW